MWGFARHGRWLAGALLGGCLALVLTAAPAAIAELSSVDAYGGQAQVLGKPVHRHAAANGSKSARGSSGAHGQSAGATGSEAGGESGQSSSGSSAAGSNAPASSGSKPLTTASGAAGTGASSAHGGHAGAHRAGTHRGVTAAGQNPPIAAANLADVSNGSLSLSALDILLLVAVFAGLAGVGVLIRRWSQRQAQ
ncbi:MAG TPA: hypothetical protein VGH60_07210 [Solirubrobacteraceae bacterium]|jgi:hypothetical protein